MDNDENHGIHYLIFFQFFFEVESENKGDPYMFQEEPPKIMPSPILLKRIPEKYSQNHFNKIVFLEII